MQGEPQIGTQVGGYRIESLIGRSGMSVVYLAEDLRLERKVALKLLSTDLARDEMFRDRFMRESKLASSLDPRPPNKDPRGGIAAPGSGPAHPCSGGRGSGRRPREGTGSPGCEAGQHPGHPSLRSPVASTRVPDRLRPHQENHLGFGPHGTGQFVGTLDYAGPEQFEGKPLDAGPTSTPWAVCCTSA
jgi:serine/threonine protein kinase